MAAVVQRLNLSTLVICWHRLAIVSAQGPASMATLLEYLEEEGVEIVQDGEGDVYAVPEVTL